MKKLIPCLSVLLLTLVAVNVQAQDKPCFSPNIWKVLVTTRL